MKTRFKIILPISIAVLALASIYAGGNLYQAQNADCWYEDSDGNRAPCKMETGTILFAPPQPDDECDEQCPDGTENIGKNTVNIEGEIAQEICQVTGGECPPFYPGNIQDDGSVMVGFVISEGDKLTHYQFFIKDGKLTYDKTSIGEEG